jgi:hypothetical protein
MGSLSQKGYTIEEKPVWSALPTLTATCKPSVSPVKAFITGDEVNTDFEPIVAETGQSLKGGYHFKKLLAGKQLDHFRQIRIWRWKRLCLV